MTRPGRSAGIRRVGYAPGVFDLFHLGHLNLLRAARDHCDLLIAGVVTDDLSEGRKGARPTVPEAERFAIVDAIRHVDHTEVEDTSKVDMWRRTRFDVLIKGDDWLGTEKGRQLEAALRPFEVEVAYVPYTRVTSTTARREAILATGRVG